MYRLTKAYRTWNSSPEHIHEATCPEDFAHGLELKLLEVEGKVIHLMHHIKQHFHLNVDLFCECSEFEKFGL